jgi:TetR/AcrR family transcriptional regulator, transcriptional repressor for nem operon
MKVSREQATYNRERIVEAAAQLFRERGFEGIGVADLMKEAGLTHGGFYGHFSSKEDLIAQASARALAHSLALWSKLAERAPGDPLSAIAGVSHASRQSRRRLSSRGAWTGRVATGPGRAARRHGLCAFRFGFSGEAGSGQIESSKKTEGHQHLRNIGRSNGHGARGR